MKCFAHTRDGRFQLRRPEDDAEWNRYHCIRERALWNGLDMKRVFGPYDRNHPVQYGDDYTALVLLRNGTIIGTAGLQDMGRHKTGRQAGVSPVEISQVEISEVEVRGVAIDPACQKQGYGGVMMMLIERYASIRGYGRAGVWSCAHMVLFYARSGYIHRPSHMPVRLECPVQGAIPMTKRLDLGVAQNDGSVLIAAA